MAPQNLASIANLIGQTIQGAVVYEAVHHNPLLAKIPILPWQGDGDTYTYAIMTATPTAEMTDIDGSSLSSTKATFGQATAYLRNLVSQGELSLFARSRAITRHKDAKQQHMIAHSRALVRKLLNQFVAGQRQSVSIGATAASKGVDGFVAQARSSVSQSSGIVYLKFTDANDTLELSTDGGASYGPAVTCDQDLVNQPIYDADGQEFRITFDVSDSAGGGDWTTSDAATGVTVSSSYNMDGLISLVHGEQMIWGNGSAVGSTSAYTASDYAPSANGDALTLKTLDRLINLVPWAKISPNRCAFIMPQRTVITLKHLLGVGGGGTAGAGASVDEWMGTKLSTPMLGYSGIPVLENPDVAADIGVGSTTDATTIYLAYMDPDNGLHAQWTNEQTVALPTADATGRIASDADLGSTIPLPFYARWLAESESKEANIFRVSGKWSLLLRNKQALAAVQGITD